MDKDQILKEVNEIFIDVLDDDVVLGRETTADDVEDWDSLVHMQLILAIEKHFKIKFISSEIMNFKNVGEMCDRIFVKKN
jgi:acyl carrier protein